MKACRVEVAPQETILVGANNSGKTSAMDSMILLLKRDSRKKIATTDFTLFNWTNINRIGTQWTNDDKPDLTLEQWFPYLPAIDIWLDVNEADIHHVIHIIPTLDWTPDQLIGIRLILAPKDTEKLYKEFLTAYKNARETESSISSENESKLSLWPETIRDFLDRELHRHFEVKAYILEGVRKDISQPKRRSISWIMAI